MSIRWPVVCMRLVFNCYVFGFYVWVLCVPVYVCARCCMYEVCETYLCFYVSVYG
jgi:hypothetical protein